LYVEGKRKPIPHDRGDQVIIEICCILLLRKDNQMSCLGFVKYDRQNHCPGRTGKPLDTNLPARPSLTVSTSDGITGWLL